MKYYKSENGEIFAYELDGSQDEFIPAGLKKMAKKEVTAHFKAIEVELEKGLAKQWRDAELSRADVELSKVLDGMGTGTEKGWRDYRCALRDWPASESFPKIKPTAPDA